MKLTDWFEQSVKPTIPGVYEIEGVIYNYHFWDGDKWLEVAAESPDEAARKADGAVAMPKHIQYIKNCKWRGLAEDPDRSKP